MQRANETSAGLLGRRQECATLDDLIVGVMGGGSASLVLFGEAGIGKTALLGYVRDIAIGCRVVRVAGVEEEMELAFGGLHQLCAPFAERFDRLPTPQKESLERAFGLRTGSPPDRFLVGLAVLSLLADVAHDQPLVCLVDDVQWLDQISAQTVVFVARRLVAERVGMLFATRRPTPDDTLRGLPHLQIRGLADHDARALLAAASPGMLDERVRSRILAEARGNPLALLELPRGPTLAPPSGERPSQDEPLASRIEDGFLRRIRSLAPGTQRLLLVAAAEPVGDVALLRRAGEQLGIDVETAVSEAQAADLVALRTMVRFRHPLVRSAAYRSAALHERQEAHRALAGVIDPDLDPDRRTWHLALAATTPDETVAERLDEAGARARARGGVAAAAALLERAAELTSDRARRGPRALAAAEAKSQAGAFGEALGLLDAALIHHLDEHDRAQADLVRGRILFSSRSASAGLPLLLDAAKRLEGLDPALATDTYRDAIYAALTAGRLPGSTGLEQIAAAILTMPRPVEPSRSDLLLEGVARLVTEGYAAGVPMVQRALTAYRADETSREEGLSWLPLASRMAHNVWDFASWSSLSGSLVELARGAGALAVLPSALLLRLSNRVYAGDLKAASLLAAEAATLGEATGSTFFANYGALVIEPWRGREAETRKVIDLITHDLLLRDEGKVLTATEWAAAVLYNGLGRHDEAFEAAKRGSAYPPEMGLSTWSMVELVEAAALVHRAGEAARAVEQVTAMARASGTDWALGTGAYVAAQVSQGPEAEDLYQEAIDRLERTDVRTLTARTHLRHGEWLLGEGRRADARRSLGLAHEMLDEIGAAAYAERARRALKATGVTVRKPTPSTKTTLTPQEAQIARLAADGLTNPEIAAQVFLSAHTVEWHLRKVFAKLGVRSRRHIGAILGQETSV